ncbi:MAG: hypothetical protein ABJC33_03340 [Betaproteobacteria bacterium]
MTIPVARWAKLSCAPVLGGISATLAAQPAPGAPLPELEGIVSTLPGAAGIFAWVLFGAIGFAAFFYGRKMLAWKPMVLGVALMVYPYFIAATWALYAVGAALCVALFLFRD